MLYSPAQSGQVQGGSGAGYATLAAAIAGEPSTELTGLVPQAGTGESVLVGPATLSAVDDFYKDWIVVNTDLTPTNGLVNRQARVSSYVGATRTFTLDAPWDFSAESDFALIDPARISLRSNVAENVIVAKSIDLNLSGYRVEGRIDITAGNFQVIRGRGAVTNGIEKTNAGYLKIEADVSRRDATIYALLLTNGSDLGRCELFDCEFGGRVAGRRGMSGWAVRGCTHNGLEDTANGVPYALVESVAGVAIVLSQLDLEIESEFPGAWVYSENSITGAAGYLSAQAGVLAHKEFLGISNRSRRFACFRAVGAATLTVTPTAGAINLKIGQQSSQPLTLNAELGAVAGFPITAAILAVQDFTGTANVNLNMVGGTCIIEADTPNCITGIVTEGTVTCSGTAILDSSGFNVFPNIRSARGLVAKIVLGVRTTGTVDNRTICALIGPNTATGIHVAVTQDAANSITDSGGFTGEYCNIVRPFAVDNASVLISAGTYVVSGGITCRAVSSFICAPGTGMTGGTITLSGQFFVIFTNNASTLQYRLAGAGGTMTISNTQGYNGGRVGTLELAGSTGAGATVNNTGATITVDGIDIATTAAFCNATTATSTATVTGTVNFRRCSQRSAMVCVTATLGGGAATGPAVLTFDECVFASTLADRSGAGTITWAAATFRFRNCSIVGAFTYVGTSFSTLEAFETAFEAGLAGSGTRPTTYRLWKCVILGLPDPLMPEVIDDFTILPANAALVQGQPLTVVNTPPMQASATVAASILEGACLGAVAGAGVAAVIVKSGRIFAAVNVAVVVAGSNLVIDLVTPTQFTAGAFLPSQNGGRALEAPSATIAGKAYSIITTR